MGAAESGGGRTASGRGRACTSTQTRCGLRWLSWRRDRQQISRTTGTRTLWRITTHHPCSHIQMVQSRHPHSNEATLPPAGPHKTRLVVEYHSQPHGQEQPLPPPESLYAARRSLEFTTRPHHTRLRPTFHAPPLRSRLRAFLHPPLCLPAVPLHLLLPPLSGERRVQQTQPLPLLLRKQRGKHLHHRCRREPLRTTRRIGGQ